MSRRFRVTANFPILGSNSHQSVIVEGSSWMVAIGKASREFKRMPVMHRRRVTALSMLVEQMEGNGQVDNVVDEQPVQGDLPLEGSDIQPATEETVMEGPDIVVDDVDDEKALNDAAEAEAERLINEGEDISDI
jgi:hypothetical protein